MSCGFTPDLARMIEQMAQEKEKKALESELALKETSKQIDLAKKKYEKVTQQVDEKMAQQKYDWTASYEKWDAYVDPEDLARQEQEAREQHERAAKAMNSSCNHDHSAEQRLMDMSTKEKLLKCEEFRKMGNLFFQHGQYQRAAYHYHQALVYFEYIFPDTKEEESKLDDSRIKVMLNFAACRLKTGQLDEAIQQTTQALDIDGSNIKALYRRAQAYRMKDEFELALQDINQAIDLNPEDSTLLHEKNLLQTKILAYKLKLRQVTSAMFNPQKQLDQEQQEQQEQQQEQEKSKKQLHLIRQTPVMDDTNFLDTWRPATFGLDTLEKLLTQLEETPEEQDKISILAQQDLHV